MDRKRFEEIMSDDDIGGCKLFEPGCDALKGLIIISKYLPEKGVEGSGHEIIYSAKVDDLIGAGITESDTIELRSQNWMISEDCLASFV